MRLRARVRAVQWVDLDFDVPEPEHDDHQDSRTDQPGQVLVNEKEILAARKAAARQAKQLASEMFPDADVTIEEVVES